MNDEILVALRNIDKSIIIVAFIMLCQTIVTSIGMFTRGK